MNDEAESFRVWHGQMLAETFAILIALPTTVVPSKTGSDTGLAGLFFHGPSFLQELLVNLAAVTIILVLLAIGIALWWRRTGSGQPSGSG